MAQTGHATRTKTFAGFDGYNHEAYTTVDNRISRAFSYKQERNHCLPLRGIRFPSVT